MRLAERRTKFVYEAARCLNEATGAPINPEPWELRDAAFRKNMIKAVAKQCGMDRSDSPEQLHDEWVEAYGAMGWTYGPVRDAEKKTHPDMVGYWDLGIAERHKDRQYMELCDIARRWIVY